MLKEFKKVLVMLISGAISFYGIYEYVKGHELNYWFGCVFLVAIFVFMMSYIGFYQSLTRKDEESEATAKNLKDVHISKEELAIHNFNYGRPTGGKTDFAKIKMLSSKLIKELTDEDLRKEFSNINNVLLITSNSLVLQDEYQIHDLKFKQDELTKEMRKRNIPIYDKDLE